ncbi:MAG: chorismate mutase [Streptococcus sp.]
MDALSKIRLDIDNIDRQLIRLWPNINTCGKGRRLKPKEISPGRASDRVAQVIANVARRLELGLSPDVAESVWRSMIQAFIALEESE